MKIAFSGKISAGKDTAAEYLISKHSGSKHSFAKPIYDIMHYAQRVCGFPQEKDRQFLQVIGTEWARSKDDNVWVKTAIRNTPMLGNVFLTDLRYPGELHALKMNDWFTVRIKRPLQDNDRLGSGSHTHTSETALDNTPDSEYDYVIDNDGTLEDFYEKLDDMYFSLQQRYQSTAGWYAYPHIAYNWLLNGYAKRGIFSS
jgi:hypothetical protein